MAVRRGVAVGGDGDELRAAAAGARRARPEESRAKLTLSLTPVLCDQLEAPGAVERCVAFLREIRAEIAPARHRGAVGRCRRRSRGRGARALGRRVCRRRRHARAARNSTAACCRRWAGTRAGPPRRRTRSCRCWRSTSRSSCSCESASTRTGHRFGEWGGGFWLPECAYAPWLHGAAGRGGGPRHVRRADRTARPRRRADTCSRTSPTTGRCWCRSIGRSSTSSGATMATRPVPRTATPTGARLHDHHVWANDGSVYDPSARAPAGRRRRARVRRRRCATRLAAVALCVCALDTELLGHWWYEGPLWLEAVIAEAERQGLTLTTLDAEALARHRPDRSRRGMSSHPASSWGAGGDLRTWSAPSVADLAWQAAAPSCTRSWHGRPHPVERALRELLALQSSDWAFLAYRDWAGDYPRQRASGHAAQLDPSTERARPRSRTCATSPRTWS